MQDLAPGTLIDNRFEITGVVGRGGFATVYSGIQRNINREVAIKVLHLNLDGEMGDNFRARFRREAQSAGRIHHPGIVKIHDFGLMKGDKPYLVMELLRGRDLEAELDGGPMETARALKLVVGCLDAIQAGHTLGIVHKDLKPANLFLTNPMELTEMLRVTDFGIAATTDEQDGRLTQAGLQVGSPQYMAPEYLLDHAVSPTIDVYQMALILVEMLTGEAVVNDPSNFACLKIHARGRLPIPAKLLDCPLGPILTAALARDPMARFQSAGAFQTALMSVKAEDVPAILPTDERRILSPGTPPLPVSIGQKVSEPVEDVAALVAIANQDTAGEAGAALGARAARGEVASAATVVQPVVGLAGPETTHPLPTSRPVPKLALAGLASLIVAGFLLVVVGIVMDTDDSGPAEDTGAASASTTPDGDRPTVAAPDPEPEPDASVAVVADTPAGEPAPATVTVKVSVRPDNAEVYRGKEKLGRGSARLTFPSANADAIGLRVRAAGHKTRTVSIVPADAPTVMIKLVKKSRPTAGSGFLE